MDASNPKVEPVVFLLAALMLVFSFIVILCEKVFPNDGQVFQVFSNLLAGISGAFLMRIKPRGSDPDTSTSKTTTTIDKDAGTLVQETQVGQTVTPIPPKASE